MFDPQKTLRFIKAKEGLKKTVLPIEEFERERERD